MNVRMPLNNREKQRAKDEAVKISTRLIPLMFIALNDEFGFGASRLERIYRRFIELTHEYTADDIGDEKLKRRLEQMHVEW